ncbi:isochorismatase family protein [Xanthomonas prunicola]|uniref:Isochorismatase family protein n=1 Tax=Xanthomonas prunicola TaxID=2053930 RepID=A0A9Q9MNA8_9XANT|nr:isochorismatase family protein [Xanthomonas prunicola]UXA47460.1 isochorismatase family protein [Xanthomonas prunicola]UXA54688.1 isochorismatase family protein [Xanthomonas prunicola]UXA55920.1 isochorismatase family protein [Xanthomonas prunicola]UXA61897.1 isochorismatase family protein [Xanthomonas prunicola]UXA64092.1 isochorismatase family protein [Xanthomonas prunicola]
MVIAKQHVNAFRETPLAQQLQQHSVAGMAVVGAMSRMCVDACLRARCRRPGRYGDGAARCLRHDGPGFRRQQGAGGPCADDDDDGVSVRPCGGAIYTGVSAASVRQRRACGDGCQWRRPIAAQ